MKIKLITISKTDRKYLEEGIALYTQRINRYTTFEIIKIPDLKNAKNLSIEEIKKKEGETILQKITGSPVVVLLDDKGKQYTSLEFSGFIQTQMNLSTRELCFVIGGPYGFSPEVYASASHKLSLSKMTFSHQIIRVIFVEQLYRAFTIMNGEPYHHE